MVDPLNNDASAGASKGGRHGYVFGKKSYVNSFRKNFETAINYLGPCLAKRVPTSPQSQSKDPVVSTDGPDNNVPFGLQSMKDFNECCKDPKKFKTLIEDINTACKNEKDFIEIRIPDHLTSFETKVMAEDIRPLVEKFIFHNDHRM